MGLLDNFMPGETYGMPTQPKSKFTGLLDDPMFQFGLGVLANSQGTSLGQALGQGGQMAAQNLNQRRLMDQQAQHIDMQKKLQDMQLQQAQAKIDAENKRKDWAATYGQPNAETEIDGGYSNAQQGTDAPNFNMVKNPAIKQPIFDQNKWILSGVAAGAVDPAALIKQDAPHTLAEGGVLVKPDGTVLYKNEKTSTQNDNKTTDVKSYEYAVANGYKGSFTDFMKIKPTAMLPIAQAQLAVSQGNLGVAQGNLGLNQQKASYELPSMPTVKPQSFSVSVGGKTYTFPDQKSMNNFKLKAGVR